MSVKVLSCIRHRLNVTGFQIDFAAKCRCLHWHPLWPCLVIYLKSFGPCSRPKYMTFNFFAFFHGTHLVTLQPALLALSHKINSWTYHDRIHDSTFIEDCFSHCHESIPDSEIWPKSLWSSSLVVYLPQVSVFMLGVQHWYLYRHWAPLVSPSNLSSLNIRPGPQSATWNVQ